jgi:hypothetical protein
VVLLVVVVVVVIGFGAMRMPMVELMTWVEVMPSMMTLYQIDPGCRPRCSFVLEMVKLLLIWVSKKTQSQRSQLGDLDCFVLLGQLACH